MSDPPLMALIDLEQSLERVIPQLNEWYMDPSYQADDPEGRASLIMSASEARARVKLALDRLKVKERRP